MGSKYLKYFLLLFCFQSCGDDNSPIVQALKPKELPEAPLDSNLAAKWIEDFTIPHTLSLEISRAYLRTMPIKPLCDLNPYEKKDWLRFDEDLHSSIYLTNFDDSEEPFKSFRNTNSTNETTNILFEGTNEDLDMDLIPADGSFSLDQIYKSEFRGRTEKTSASFHDEDKNDWKSGYTKDINFRAAMSGGSSRSAGCDDLLTKSDSKTCQKNIEEKVDVKLNNGIYTINLDREILTNAALDTAWAQYHAYLEVEPELLTAKTKCYDNSEIDQESLVRRGLIKKLEGDFAFDYEGKRYKTKFKSTPLRYDILTYDFTKILWKMQDLDKYGRSWNIAQILFDDGTIEYKDSFGNKMEVIYKRSTTPKPAECLRVRARNPDREIEYQLSIEMRFNDKTVNSKTVKMCLSPEDLNPGESVPKQ